MKNNLMKSFVLLLCTLFLWCGCASVDLNTNVKKRYKKDPRIVAEENENLDTYVHIEDLEGGKVSDKWGNVSIQMDIEIPDVANVSVSRHDSVAFSEKQLTDIVDAFTCSDTVLYDVGQPSLDYYKNWLADDYDELEAYELWKQEIKGKEPEVIEEYNAKTGETGYITIDEEYLDSEIQFIKGRIENLQNIIDNYKPEDRKEIRLEYSMKQDFNGEEELIARAAFDNARERDYIITTLWDGKILRIGPRDLESSFQSEPMMFGVLQDDGSYDKTIGITKSEGRIDTERFLKEVCPYMDVRAVYPARYDDGIISGYTWAYYCTRSINDMEVGYEDHDIDMALLNRPPIRYEYLVVYVSSDGLEGIYWQFPLEQSEVITENVKLMPINDVLGIAKEYFEIQEYEGMSVKHMKLSYTRIDKQNDYNSFYYIPVWDFYGEIKPYDPGIDFDIYSFLTINAMDGTIIDRSKGY